MATNPMARFLASGRAARLVRDEEPRERRSQGRPAPVNPNRGATAQLQQRRGNTEPPQSTIPRNTPKIQEAREANEGFGSWWRKPTGAIPKNDSDSSSWAEFVADDSPQSVAHDVLLPPLGLARNIGRLSATVRGVNWFDPEEEGQEPQKNQPQKNHPQIIQGGAPPPAETGFLAEMGKGQLRMAEAKVKPLSDAYKAVDDWFHRSVQDASSPINAEPLSVTGKRIEEAQLRNDSDDRLLPGIGEFSSRELNLNELEGYNARQRAAIEFNTALRDAVEADRELFGEKADEEYLSRVEEMFGVDGGSERYAPNTMKLLESLGYQDTERGDLDNFLDLNALVTDEELERLGSDTFEPKEDDSRGLFAIQISETAQASLSAVLAKGQTLLDSFKEATTVNPNLETSFAQEQMSNFLNLATQGVLTDQDVSEWYGLAEEEFGVPANEIAEYMDRVASADVYAAGTPTFNQEQLARFFGRETA